MIRIYALIRNQKSRLFILTVDVGYYRITGIHYPGKTGTHYSGISGVGYSGIYSYYRGTKEELEYMIERIEIFKAVSYRICKEQIVYYGSKIETK